MKNDANLQHLSSIKTVEFKTFTPDGLQITVLDLSRYEYFTSKDSDISFDVFAVIKRVYFRSIMHDKNTQAEEILFTDNELDTAQATFKGICAGYIVNF